MEATSRMVQCTACAVGLLVGCSRSQADDSAWPHPARLKVTQTLAAKSSWANRAQAEEVTAEGYRQVSPDGKHVITRVSHETQMGPSWTVVIDGVPGKSYEGIESAQFNVDGTRNAYIGQARSPTGRDFSAAVIDGVEGKPYRGGVHDLSFSPDGKHVAFIGGRGSEINDHLDDVLVVDGVEGPPIREIIAGTLCYSPSGRLAYAIKGGAGPVGSPFARANPNDDEIQVLLDGKPIWRRRGVQQLPAVNSNCSLLFSGDGQHLAFVATVMSNYQQRAFVVVDGKEGRTYQFINSETLRFSPNGRPVAYIAQSSMNGTSVAVIDGHDGPACSSISDLAFSADGRRVAYIGQRADGNSFCGTEQGAGKSYQSVSGLTLSPAGGHIAFVAMRAGNDSAPYSVVEDGKEGKSYIMIDAESLRYSPDGQHLAYVGSKSVDPNAGTTKSYFVLDDAELKEYEFPGPDAHSITFSPGGRHLAYSVTEFDMTGSQKAQTSGAVIGKTFVVVNGAQSDPFDFGVIQDDPIFDNENHFHFRILAPPDKTQRVDVEIEDNS
jgi:hypothetical protein